MDVTSDRGPNHTTKQRSILPGVEKEMSTGVVSVFAVGMLSCVLAVLYNALWHWFMVPVTVAGMLIATDVVEWARGRLSPMEPRALVAIFGLHFFYIVPILHVMLQHWPLYVPPAVDWEHSIGVLAIVNCFGLIIYRLTVGTTAGFPARRTLSAPLDEARFRVLMHAAIGLSFAAFAYMLIVHGGPRAYLNLVMDRQSRENLVGAGWLLILAEAWPLLCFVLLAVRHRFYLAQHLLILSFALLIFAGLQFGVSGLRGSRANLVWPLLIGVGVVHLVVHPVRKLAIGLGVMGLVLFVWAYGFYKAVGVEVVGVFEGSTTVSRLSDDTGRTLPLVLLEDLGRTGVQAILVDRLEGRHVDLAWGETYVGDLALLIPEPLVAAIGARDKVAVGTEVLYGTQTSGSGFESSRIYGLTGEAMINFGLAGGAAIFGLLGLLVRFATRVYRSAKPGLSGANVVAPALAALCVISLASDLDNTIFFSIKHVLPLATVVALSMSKGDHQK